MSFKEGIIVLGEDGAGKGTASRILAEIFGYHSVTVSDPLRKIAERRSKDNPKIDQEPATLRAIADRFRSIIGPHAAVALAMRDLDPKYEKFVFDSLRHPAEVGYVENCFKLSGGRLWIVEVYVDDPDVSYERYEIRKREGDILTKEAFLARKKEEAENPDPNKLQVRETIKLRQYRIPNNKDKAALLAEIIGFHNKVVEGHGLERERE